MITLKRGAVLGLTAYTEDLTRSLILVPAS